MVGFLLLCLCLTACVNDKKEVCIFAPRYLSRQAIQVQGKEVQLGNVKAALTPELSRMLDSKLEFMLEQWIELRFKPVSNVQTIIVDVPELRITEEKIGCYMGVMKTIVRTSNPLVQQVSSARSFEASASTRFKKQQLYLLVQDLIDQTHVAIQSELSR